MSSDVDEPIEGDENLECEIQRQQPVSSDTFSVVDLLSKLDLRDRSRVRSNTRRGRQGRRKQIVSEKRVTDQGCSAERLFRTADNVFKVKSSRDGKENTRPVRGKGTTMSYADMCLRDSQALAKKCPAYFGQVDVESYALVEATKVANQLNMTQPKLVEKETIMSKDQCIPMKNTTDGLLYFEELKPKEPGNNDDEEKQQQEQQEEEEDALPFDFAENAKTHSNVYERVELSEEKEEQADELRQKYMDILAKLQENVEKQTKRARVDTVDEESTGKDGSQEADDPQESDDTRPSLYPNAIRVFAVEYVRDKEGKKNSFKFRTCPVSVAWKVHLENDPSNLHWYEILRTDFPCHLYFDLEYATCDNLNATCDGDALVDTLLEVTRARMKKDFDLLIQDKDIYELDSTSAQKFSRHLIIKVPGYAFCSSVVVGEFVSQICADSGTSLLVQTKDGRQTYFVDTAVYTKNRLFRMVYNCKAGKTSNLMPTGRFAMARSPRLTPAAVFSETLLMSVDESSTLLLVRPQISMIMAKRGVNSVNGPDSRGIKIDNEYSFLPNKTAMAHLDSLARAAIPTIEKFASDRAKLPASVRNYTICGGYGSVAYNLQGEGAHFCSNKGGPHNQNFVYIVANFFTLRMAQKCHDVDCRKYKSASSEMPEKFRWDPSTYE